LTFALLFTLAALDVETFLAEARRGGADGSVGYRDPGPWERAVQGAWFTAVFAAASRPEAVVPLLPLARLGGLRAGIAEDRGRPVVLVTDLPGRRQGAGAYVVRLGPVGTEAFVQVPHSWSDLGTLPIGRALFRAVDARVLGVNTVHRRGRAGEEATVRGDADVAHRVESTFQTATVAWLRAGRGGALVQVHGFADERVPFDAVVSAGPPADGTGRPPWWLERFGSALAAALPGARIAVFPPDGERLAGLANVQAQAAVTQGARFLHLELGASLRQQLREETACAALARVLVEVLHAQSP